MYFLNLEKNTIIKDKPGRAHADTHREVPSTLFTLHTPYTCTVLTTETF